MKKEYYFVVSVFFKERNMKEKVLAEYLKSYKNCLVEFGKMELRPVRRWVAGSSSNGKSDAE